VSWRFSEKADLASAAPLHASLALLIARHCFQDFAETFFFFYTDHRTLFSHADFHIHL